MKPETITRLLTVLGVLTSAAACWRTNVDAVTARGSRDASIAGSDGSFEAGVVDGSGSGAVPSAGCGKTSTLTFAPVPNQDPNAAEGSGHTVGHGVGGYVTIKSSGKSRNFTMRLPDNYDPNHPYWLSFTFHTGGGNAWGIDNGGDNGYFMAYYGLQRLSNNGAIFVAPEGLNGAWGNANGEDLKFTDDLVKLIEENYCVDTTHIFAQGFAYGGAMTYAIACARAKVFRGVAIYEGAVFSGCDNGNDPIAYWQMVGLTDNTCTIDMAKPMRDQFAKNNGCTIPKDEPPQPPMPPPYLNPGGHKCTNYTGCSAGHPLRWCVHQSGLGNGVVDGTPDLYDSCATAPKTCSDTCPCTWVPQDVWDWMNNSLSTGGGASAADGAVDVAGGSGRGDSALPDVVVPDASTSNDAAGDDHGGGVDAGCADSDSCVCPTLSVAVVGKPGVWGDSSDSAFQDWLKSNIAGTAKVDNYLNKPAFTSDFLAGYNLLVLAGFGDNSNTGPWWTFGAAEVAAFRDWIENRGGGVISLAGYSGDSNEIAAKNALLAFSGISYQDQNISPPCILFDANGDKMCYRCGNPYQIDEWNRTDPVIADLSVGVKMIGIDGGHPINAPADAHVAAMKTNATGIDNWLVGKIAGKGRVLVYADEWITYTDQWSGHGNQYANDPSCKGFLPQDLYQTGQLWYNMIRWAQPSGACLK